MSLSYEAVVITYTACFNNVKDGILPSLCVCVYLGEVRSQRMSFVVCEMTNETTGVALGPHPKQHSRCVVPCACSYRYASCELIRCTCIWPIFVRHLHTQWILREVPRFPGI